MRVDHFCLFACAGLSVLFGTNGAWAQVPGSSRSVIASVDPGSLVRVLTVGGLEVVGNLEYVGQDSMGVQSATQETAVFGFSQIDSFWVRSTSRRRGETTGAVIGGVLLGASMGVLSAGFANFNNPSEANEAGAFLLGFAIGGAIGTVIGAATGHAVSRGTPVWLELYPGDKRRKSNWASPS